VFPEESAVTVWISGVHEVRRNTARLRSNRGHTLTSCYVIAVSGSGLADFAPADASVQAQARGHACLLDALRISQELSPATAIG